MNRTLGTAFLLLTTLAIICTACNDPGHAPAGDTTATDAGPAPDTRTMPTGSAPDSTFPPLAPAPEVLAKDTVPLRAPDGSPARYGLKSGLIVQQFVGNSVGKRRIIFDDYGLRERREENTVPNPPGSRGAINNIITIATPEENAYADIRTQRGWKRANEGIGRYLASPESKTMSLAEYVIHTSGATRLPDTTINGYECTVLQKGVQGMTITNWIWRGIVIREHLVSPRDSVEYFVEPVEIIPDIDVPDSTFRFPAGYQIDAYVPPATKP